MQWVAEVGAATGRTVAYVGGLAEISANSLRLLFLSPLKRSRMLQRAIHEAMAVEVRRRADRFVDLLLRWGDPRFTGSL
jgi:hypothetical protein